MRKRYRRARAALVEDEEALENLEILLVEYGASDTVVQLLIREWLLRLKALVGKRGPTSINQYTNRSRQLQIGAYMSRCASSIGYCTIAKFT
jgi:hypothetical protein